MGIATNGCLRNVLLIAKCIMQNQLADKEWPSFEEPLDRPWFVIIINLHLIFQFDCMPRALARNIMEPKICLTKKPPSAAH